MFRDAYRRLNGAWKLVAYPFVLDALALAAGWSLAGLAGGPKWSLKWLLDIGLPSLSHISNNALLANSLDYLRVFGQDGSAAGVVVVGVLLLLRCYAQGGYIAGLQSIARGGKPDLAHFMRNGKAWFIPFIMYNIIVYIAMIGVTLGLSALFGPVGPFFSLLVFAVLRIVWIYLEFTMVVDRLSWDQVLGRSRSYWNGSRSKTAIAVVVLYVASGGISLLLHRFWSPAAVIVALLAYAYVMTGIQLALMIQLCRMREQGPNREAD